jgi:hypothetical protein
MMLEFYLVLAKVYRQVRKMDVSWTTVLGVVCGSREPEV